MPTIALVDDDRNILTSVSMALEAECYRIMTYTDGASALDGFKTSPPDLAILDIKMPRMDGLEVLRAIRSDPTLNRQPVVILTSSREEKDLITSYDLGVNAYVVKPVEFDSFISAVKQLGVFWGVINELPPVRTRQD